MGWLRSPLWRDVVFWALDLEATGLDPQCAEVLSIGMVPIRHGAIHWGERWYRLVKPTRAESAATEAIVVHGILPGELDDAASFSDLIPEVAGRLEGAALLVHWGRLDVTLLKRAFSAAGRSWPRPPVVDTVGLLAKLDRRRRLIEPAPKPTPTQLGQARAALGLPPHVEHHALYDALATAELMLALRARLGLRRLRHLR